MRSVLLKWTLGLCIVVGSIFTGGFVSAQTYFEYSLLGQPNECLGVGGGNMNNGTDFILWPCNAQPPNYTGARDQAFFTATYDYIWTEWGQYFSVRDALNNNKCMGVSGGSYADGANIMIWDCLGKTHTDQYWQFDLDKATNCYVIWDLNSGMYLAPYVGLRGGNQAEPVVQSLDSNQPVEWCQQQVTP
jgi:hypothetical protein